MEGSALSRGCDAHIAFLAVFSPAEDSVTISTANPENLGVHVFCTFGIRSAAATSLDALNRVPQSTF
jgi:hypothetical protein